MKFNNQTLSQAERRAILLLAIVALIAIAVTALRSCRSNRNGSIPPETSAEMSPDSIVETSALLPDTIMPVDTVKPKRPKAHKPASSAYKTRNILDETL